MDRTLRAEFTDKTKRNGAFFRVFRVFRSSIVHFQLVPHFPIGVIGGSNSSLAHSAQIPTSTEYAPPEDWPAR
jgi:hypothetical protein